jgi:hypothetical protein
MADNLSKEVTNDARKSTIYKALRWVFAFLLCCTVLFGILWRILWLSSPTRLFHVDCQIHLGSPDKMSAEEEACQKIIAAQDANNAAIDGISITIPLLIFALSVIGLNWAIDQEKASNQSLPASAETENDKPQA